MKPAITTAILILFVATVVYALVSMKQECGARHVLVSGSGAFECVAASSP